MTGYDEFAGGRVAGNKNDISAWIADSAAWLPVVTWPAAPADRTPRRSREP